MGLSHWSGTRHHLRLLFPCGPRVKPRKVEVWETVDGINDDKGRVRIYIRLVDPISSKIIPLNITKTITLHGRRVTDVYRQIMKVLDAS